MEKKIKLRKCQGCQKKFDKEELIKITKLDNGELKINPSSKELGRSVYVCKNEKCIKTFIKKKRLKTSLKFNNLEIIEKIEKKLTTICSEKFIIIILFFCLISNVAFTKDYSSYCSVYKPQKNLKGVVSSTFGINFFTRRIIESSISKAIYRQTGSKLKVKIDNSYGINSLEGEFEKISANSKKLNYRGINLTNVEVQSVCPYNKIEYKKGKIYFSENMVLNYKAQLTQEDLNDYIFSSNYKNLIKQFNENPVINAFAKIKGANIEIKNDKIILKYEIIPLPRFGFEEIKIGNFSPIIRISLKSNLRVENGKIEVCDFGLNSFKADTAAFLPIINQLNPLNYKILLSKKQNAEINVENVKIENSKINFDGNILIRKKSNN